jgi:hypothetical protein
MGIQMGTQGLMMKYSRNDESQADSVGTVILYKAGYNPQGMVDFFKTMGSQGGSAPPEFFSSHPNPDNRQHAIEKQIANWPAQNFVGDSPEWQNLRQHAAQVKSYTAAEIAQGARSGQWAALNQRNGASLNSSGASTFSTRAASEAAPATGVSLQNILPTGNMVATDLGPMKIQHPENWQVKPPEQQGQFVIIAPQAGIANDNVGYGVLLNGVPAPRGQRMSVDEMTNTLIQHMQKGHALEQLGKPQPITVGGLEGRSTLLQSASPFPDANGQQQKERDWLVTVPRNDGSMVFMIFVAPEADFPRLQPTYEAMLKSAQFK